MDEPEGFARIVRAIQKGMVIANHSYAHERTSEIGFESQTQQIRKTQELIDRAYEEAGIAKPPRYFRFPHLDRGCGNAWAIDFETVPEAYRDFVIRLFRDGLRLESLTPPTSAQIQLKQDIQTWLKDNGFVKFSPPDVTFPWWTQSELSKAIDCQFTYSTSDWMATPRHLGKWPYKNISDLCHKIDDDPSLTETSSSHIILMHDDREDSLTITQSLATHFLNQDFRFLPFLP